MVIAVKAPKDYRAICKRVADLDYLARYLNICKGEQSKAMAKSVLKAISKYEVAKSIKLREIFTPKDSLAIQLIGGAK